MSKQQWREVSKEGVPCISCGQKTQIREHIGLREKHFKQPFYFKQWYCCINKSCKTEIFMQEKDKVWNRNKAANQMKTAQEYNEQLDFINHII